MMMGDTKVVVIEIEGAELHPWLQRGYHPPQAAILREDMVVVIIIEIEIEVDVAAAAENLRGDILRPMMIATTPKIHTPTLTKTALNILMIQKRTHLKMMIIGRDALVLIATVPVQEKAASRR